MLIDEIELDAFRGIPDPLRLNLRASLTVLYAPNGVGKTSICDSVEWLLTGEVNRLCRIIKARTHESLQNIFRTNSPARVECKMQAGSQYIHIRRTNGDRTNQINIAGEDGWREAPLDHLYSFLTPSSLSQRTSTVHRVNSRRNWLRAARFLDNNCLDLLIDSTEDGQHVRDLLFCDLLGLGEIERDRRNLEKITVALGAPSRLERELAEARNELGALDALIRSEALQASAPLLGTFDSQIADAAQILNLQLPVGERETRLAILQAAWSHAHEMIQLETDALQNIVSRSHRFDTVIADINMLRRRDESLRAELKTVEGSKNAVRPKISDVAGELSKLEKAISVAASFPIDKVHDNLIKGTERWHSAGQTDEALISVESFEDALREAEAKFSAIKERIATLEHCEATIPLWQEAAARERAARKRLSKPQFATEQEILATRQDHANASQLLIKLKLDYERLAEPHHQLAAAAKAYLEIESNDDCCPLCGHDHGHRKGLEEAIKTSLAAIPTALEVLSKEISTVVEKVTTFEDRIESWREYRADAESSLKDLREARQTLSHAESILAQFSVTIEGITSGAALTRLQQEKLTLLQYLEDQTRSLEQLRRCAESATNLSTVAEQLIEVSRQAQALGASVPSLEQLRKSPLRFWRPALHEFHSALITSTAASQLRMDDLRQELQIYQTTLQDLEYRANALASSLEELQEQLASAEKIQAKFLDDWRTIAGESEFDTSRITESSLRIQKAEENLRRGKHMLSTAEATLKSARDAEMRERDLAGRKQRLGELRRRVLELEATLETRQQCLNGANILAAAKDKFIAEQIKPLCDVITAFYVRAQSNAFIDRIDRNVDDQPLRWLARIGDHQLEDPAQMSLGQRQDLALGIFFARARELGGTFFLDEPLGHLDDLNRVAVMDVLRTILVEKRATPLRMVMTTANQTLVRHCREKFSLVAREDGQSAFRAYHLTGDAQSGVAAEEIV